MDKVYKCLGTSNHCPDKREQHDFYATDPDAIDALLSVETFQNDVWECCCGEGHLSKRLEENGYNVFSSDLIDRGYGHVHDFMDTQIPWRGDIISNPPYSSADEFTEKALSVIKTGAKAAFFLKLQFLEGQKRRKLYDVSPPCRVHVFSKRMKCAKNGRFDLMKGRGSAIAYAWFVWQKGFTGQPVIGWI